MILRGNDGLYYEVSETGEVSGPLVMRNSHVTAPLTPSYARGFEGRLPAADIVGFRPGSPGVEPGGEESRGRSPGESFPQTWRPLAGLPSNKHGGAAVIDTCVETSGLPYVLVDARSQGEDAEQIQVCMGFETQGELPTSVLADINIAATALLEWGIGGASFKAQCDWIQGNIIALPANFLRVSVIPPANIQVAPPGTIPPFVYSAGLAYGYGRRHCNTARLTTTSQTLAPAATSSRITIPPFAVSYSVVARGTTEVPLTIFQVAPSTVSSPRVTHQYTGVDNGKNQQDYMFPIVNGARYLSVTNDSAVQVKFQVIFGLAF